jgi:sulfur-oxidizing protein SoxA
MLKKAIVLAGAAALTGLASTAALAGPDDDELVIGGATFVTELPGFEGGPLDPIYSGWRFRDDATQELETDDFGNPAFVFVEQAAESWNTVVGTEGKSCASCHGAVEESMKGVRASMPSYNEAAGELWSLENYVNNCRTERMGADALIALQARGMPVTPVIDGPAAEWFERGKEMYYTRFGQLELSCANCHEDHTGDMIRADHLSQGQINGFPTYRLKNTKLNSSHGRFKGCIRDTRAETFAPGSAEFRALELYVAWRGQGLSVESPSVRN